MKTRLIVASVLALSMLACSPAPTAPMLVAPTSVAPGDDVPRGPYAADSVWALLASSPGQQRRAESLAGAVDFAELVLVGRYAAVERGGRYGDDWTAVSLIAIDSVAKGTPELGPDRRLRVEFILSVGGPSYPEKELADLRRSIPRDPALLLLFTWESYVELIGGGLPAWEAREDLARTYKTIGGDGALRVVDGHIQAPPHVGGWPDTLHGAEIEKVLESIRTEDAL